MELVTSVSTSSVPTLTSIYPDGLTTIIFSAPDGSTLTVLVATVYTTQTFFGASVVLFTSTNFVTAPTPSLTSGGSRTWTSASTSATLTPPTQNTALAANPSHGISTGAKATIAVVIPLFIITLLFVAVLYLRKRRPRSPPSWQPAAEAGGNDLPEVNYGAKGTTGTPSHHELEALGDDREVVTEPWGVVKKEVPRPNPLNGRHELSGGNAVASEGAQEEQSSVVDRARHAVTPPVLNHDDVVDVFANAESVPAHSAATEGPKNETILKAADLAASQAFTAKELDELRARQARLQERKKRLLEIQQIENEEERLQRRIEDAESRM